MSPSRRSTSPSRRSRAARAVALTAVTMAVFAGASTGSVLAADEFEVVPVSLSTCEFDTGTTTAAFNIHRNAPSAGTVTVDVDATDGTAGTGDYTDTPIDDYSFGPGVTDRPFNVTINGDGTDEGNETYNVVLTDAPSAVLNGVGTIVDDDPDPVVSINNAAANESSAASFTVSLSFAQASPCTASVLLTTLSNGATPGSDFASLNNFPVTFPSGSTAQNVSVTHFCDGLNEGTESYFVDLHTPTNATVTGGGTGAGDPGVGTIFDVCHSAGAPGSGADLLMIKEEGADPIAVGSELIYTLRVHNLCSAQGCNAAGGVTVFDPLPSGVEYVSATPTQGSCSASGSPTTIACSLGTVAVNSIPSIQVRVRPTIAADLTNTAGVTASTFDPNTANNQATVITRSFTGTTAPPPAENPTEDVTPPIANLFGPRRCFVLQDGECGVEVRSSENGTAAADGSVIIGPSQASTAQRRRRVRRVFFFRGVRRSVEAGQDEVLPLRIGRRARRAIRRALRNRRGVRARVEVVVEDQDGNERVRRRTLRIVG